MLEWRVRGEERTPLRGMESMKENGQVSREEERKSRKRRSRRAVKRKIARREKHNNRKMKTVGVGKSIKGGKEHRKIGKETTCE